MSNNEEKKSLLPKGRPLGDRILVKPFECLKVTPGGVVIPDTVKELPMIGVVVSVGDGRVVVGEGVVGVTLPLLVKKGDFVLFGKYAGCPFTLRFGSAVDQVDTYLILREEEIHYIVDPSELDRLDIDIPEEWKVEHIPATV